MGWLVFQRLLYDACMYSLADSACKRGHYELVWRVCTIIGSNLLKCLGRGAQPIAVLQ